MRDNLLFFGINEETKENTEEVLKTVLETHLSMGHAHNIQFARVHRIGRKSGNKTRPIVAKFELYKEREVVSDAFFAKLRALKEKNETTGGNETIKIGIAEQYPPEIQEKRRELIPVIKEAKKNGSDAKLIRDKLHVNGESRINGVLHSGTIGPSLSNQRNNGLI